MRIEQTASFLVDVLLLTLTSSVNMALRHVSWGRLRELYRAKGREARLEALIPLTPELLAASAILRTAVMLLLMVFCLHLVQEQWRVPASASPWVALALAMIIALIFGVAIPNAMARYMGEDLVARSEYALLALRWLFYPLVQILGVFDPFVRRLAGVPFSAQDESNAVEREILDVVSEGERKGAVGQDEREMIESVMEFRVTRVDEIMTPRTDIIAVRNDVTLEEVLRVVAGEGHSRIPVYHETIDEILGVLYAKDLLTHPQTKPFNVREVMRPALFVPESKLVRDLFKEFRQQKVHIAILVDEYGGTAGLVTIEDILEELVGEISDEHEEEEPPPIVHVDEKTYDVDARVSIYELNEAVGTSLPEDDDYETVGGLLFAKLGRIPQAGETCEVDSVAFTVLDAEARRVNRLRLTLNAPTPAQGNPA